MGIHFRHTISQGFTIVETMLVLAVTGVLIATLLVGVGTTIHVQRYQDAVVSLKSLLQSQYSMVDDVTNDRTGSWSCSASAVPVQAQNGTSPGQSDCVLLGRYVSIVDGDVHTASIVGYETATTAGVDDVATIKGNYTLGISPSSVETSTLEWGSKIAWPSSGSGAKSPTSPRALSMLIVRSPDSGTSYTFTSDTVYDVATVNSTNLKDMMITSTSSVPGQLERTLCVDPDGVAVPDVMAVYIGQAASGPSAIETRTNGITTSLGGDTKC